MRSLFLAITFTVAAAYAQINETGRALEQGNVTIIVSRFDSAVIGPLMGMPANGTKGIMVFIKTGNPETVLFRVQMIYEKDGQSGIKQALVERGTMPFAVALILGDYPTLTSVSVQELAPRSAAVFSSPLSN